MIFQDSPLSCWHHWALMIQVFFSWLPYFPVIWESALKNQMITLGYVWPLELCCVARKYGSVMPKQTVCKPYSDKLESTPAKT